RHVDRGAAARRGEVVLARVLLQEIHQLGNGIRFDVRMHDQYVGNAHGQGDRREVFNQVKGKVLVEGVVDRAGDGHHEQRITIRISTRDEFSRDIAARAGAVFYHDRLAERFADFFADYTRHNV